MPKVDIIGGGLSGLYAACYLSKQSAEVNVYEKNESVGGRSRTFQSDGFTFDMGPSWYWMPELIDDLFNDLGEKRSDYFQIQRLIPSYKIFWKAGQSTNMPASLSELCSLFDSFEKDGGRKLKEFLTDAKLKYEIATADFLENPGLKWSELINLKALKNSFKLDVFKSVEKDVSKRFQSEKARTILNFPVLFLGEMPNRIPSLYTLMNYADLELGTWYPQGGMGALANALKQIAIKNGVIFHVNSPVTKFEIEKDIITKITVNEKELNVNKIIASADYHFVEQNLVPVSHRQYSESYWNSRKMAPSCLIFYIGLSKKIEGLEHHNLFFDEDLKEHGKEIYDNPQWPKSPLFYVCVTSKTDTQVAPEGCENLFVLMPIAPGITDTKEIREEYFELILARMENRLKTKIKDLIIFKRDYCINDFQDDYNAYKGNAYGLANTLKQTANLKPKITSKLKNLFYCGQLTVPGPGIPPALISGKIVAKHLLSTYEKTI